LGQIIAAMAGIVAPSLFDRVLVLPMAPLDRHQVPAIGFDHLVR
jgi:hypothetical protein